MKIDITQQARPSYDSIIVPFFEEHLPLEDISKDEFKATLGSICLLREKGTRKLYIGFGKREKLQHRDVCTYIGKAVKELIQIGAKKIAIDLNGLEHYTQKAIEGALLAGYKFEDFLMADQRSKSQWSQLAILVSKDKLKQAKREAQRGQILADACNRVRQLGNLPGNVITPEELASQAKKLAREVDGLSCKIWNKQALKRDRFGGLLAVGGGSINEPRFIVINYNGGKKNAPKYAVVGKAITFDTGGISIKPGAQMDEMKFDKMGGCAVVGVMEAIAKLKLPINLTGIISSAENMPDGAAYRPGDIVTAYDGQTIEVLNTDAEGRIVLADALAYANKHIKPAFMVDMATLTGACVVALGNERAGLFTDDFERAKQFYAIGEKCGERVWHMPMGEEYDRMIDSKIARAKNIGGRWGGASTAASFLKKWAGDTPWAHLDIAGTGWTTEGYPHMNAGATGFGVRLLTQYFEQLS